MSRFNQLINEKLRLEHMCSVMEIELEQTQNELDRYQNDLEDILIEIEELENEEEE